MADRIISLDCESNGLHGQIFAVGVSVQVRGLGEVGAWTDRCPIVGEVDPWVEQYVLPALSGVLELHATTTGLQRSWRVHYDGLGSDVTAVVCHVPWPVEARFLWDSHRDTPFSGPFPLLDVASMLDAIGEDPADLDGWLIREGYPALSGDPHHPLYDARRAAQAYWALTSEPSV